MKKIVRTTLIALQNMELFQLIVDLLAYLTGKDLKTLLIDTAKQRVEPAKKKKENGEDEGKDETPE